MSEWKLRGQFNTVTDVITGNSGVSAYDLMYPEMEEPRNIQNITGAAAAIREAMKQKRPITVVGDYDSDGLNATAILVKLFGYYGIQITTMIPKRMSEGYGLSQELIDRIAPGTFVITIDNGIMAVDEVRLLKEKGCTVVVMDHHLPGDEIPAADYVIDPHVDPDNNGFRYYCGAGLGLQLARLMLEDDNSEQALYLRMELTVHAAIATITDVMPLVDCNRAIVKEGLRVINEYRQVLSPGLKALLETASTDIFDADTFGFKLGPIINAPARLYNAGGTSVLKALICNEPQTAIEYASKMVSINNSRKALVQEKTLMVMDEIQDQMILNFGAPLCVYCKNIPEGIVGIIAGKLAETYRMPAFVFSESSENGILKGSGRSGGLVDLGPILESIRPVAVKCGGHAGAAGVSVKKEDYQQMVAVMRRAMACAPAMTASDDPPIFYDMEISTEMVDGVYREMAQYAPFGEKVEKPVFLIRGFQCINKFGSHYYCMGADKNHLRLNGQFCNAVGFDMAPKYLDMGAPAVVDLLCTIQENRYNGNTSLQLSIIDFRPAQ